jgi:hypothetical protein
MGLTWRGRRQLLYYAVALVVFLIVVWAAYAFFLSAPATCQDGQQDGTEHGVDCGGTCSLICANEARLPTVLWKRSFATAPGLYTAVAYVHNSMLTSGAKKVPYSFQLFDASNVLILERTGVIDLPPVQGVPIIETNINTGTREVAHTFFCFQYQDACTSSQAPEPVWHTPPTPISIPSVSNPQLSPDGSSLSVAVVNNTIHDIRRAAVEAVLYDAQGVARAASKSIVDLPKQSTQQVVFTWPQGTPNVVRSEVVVLPPF